MTLGERRRKIAAQMHKEFEAGKANTKRYAELVKLGRILREKQQRQRRT